MANQIFQYALAATDAVRRGSFMEHERVAIERARSMWEQAQRNVPWTPVYGQQPYNHSTPLAVQQQYNNSTPLVQQPCTYSTPPVQQQCNYSAPPVQQHYNYSAPPVQQPYTYSTPLVQQQCNNSAPPVQQQQQDTYSSSTVHIVQQQTQQQSSIVNANSMANLQTGVQVTSSLAQTFDLLFKDAESIDKIV